MSKKDLIKEIGSKFDKSNLVKICDKYSIKTKGLSKKVLLNKLLKLKVNELKSILNEGVVVKSKKVKKRRVNEEVVSFKFNYWTIASIVLGVIALIILFKPTVNNQVSSSNDSVLITYLLDSNCLDCYDVKVNEQILMQYGLNLTSRSFDINSGEGRALINKYNITKVPTFILSGGDLMNNSKLISVWPSVGSFESDGSLVFRSPELMSVKFKVLSVNGSFVMFKAPEPTIGRFVVTNDDLCVDGDGRPIVYFFGSNSCPHCRWQHPVINNVTSLFDGFIDYHDNMGSQADSDIFRKYLVINRGSVPFILIGCKFARLGSGERLSLLNDTLIVLNETYPVEVGVVLNDSIIASDLKAKALIAYNDNDTVNYSRLINDYSSIVSNSSVIVDKLVLTELICNVTGGQPSSVC